MSTSTRNKKWGLLFFLSSMTLVLGACSKNDGGKTSQQYTDSYNFSEIGCETLQHDFSSNSAGDLKKQLCTALQDDKLNKSCAESLRRDYFEKKCPDYSWAPKQEVETNQPPSQPPPSLPSSPSDFFTQQMIQSSLNYVLVDSFQVEPSLTGQEQAFATQFAEDLMSCGLSYRGPKCLESTTLALAYGSSLSQATGKTVLYSELVLKDVADPILFVFALDQTSPTVKIGKLDVFKVVKPRNGQEPASYLDDKSNFSPLFAASLADDFQTAAWKRLEKPRDIRELVLVSEEILKVPSTNYDEVIKKISQTFEKNEALITQSDLVIYQERCLDLMYGRLRMSPSQMSSIHERLLASKSKSLQQTSAVYLLALDPSRTQLKTLAIEALHHERWATRKKAIEALVKTNTLSKTEENKILEAMNDSDTDVRIAAMSAGQRFKIDARNLATLVYLSQSPYWTTRKAALSMTGLIQDPSATAILIGSMSDSDSDVRVEAFAQLGKRTLETSDIQPLSVQADSTYWTVRRDVAKLLGKLQAEEAIAILIAHMSDSDQDVRDEIFTQLNSKTLTPAQVAPLAEQFKSGVWTVRRDVAKLLGKIQHPSSMKALSDQLKTETDNDVKKEIADAIEKVK